MSRVGKLVFLEGLDTDGKVSYYSGEYLVLRETANALYCVRPMSGYEGHEVKTFNLIGKSAFKVLSESKAVETAMLSRLASEQEKFAKDVDSTNRKWCETVYAGAARNAIRMREIVSEQSAERRIEIPAGSRVVITITTEQ